ncbi:double-strand break repair protein AddB [Mesobaculum littorinae]|uniref:Double-strand break repair protein AddB n=1 Tax=Mesobaculum littorinae TaxID=2486419 RepID=A0A438AH48_9RHOB|nr:double-strand break repair protein AddB [Mesobaculum littorinae]RVV97998.1 double-strand break repair protein AddB [Mesobaculum littorinae]
MTHRLFRPGLYGLPPGADFAAELVAGLVARSQGAEPEALARVELYVNTARMQRRLRDLFQAGPARLLPRIRLLGAIAAGHADTTPAVPPLRRRLQIAQLIAALLEREPDLAPRSAVFDLADSLAALLDEMQGEGVTAADLHALDVSDQSGHWARSLRFVEIVSQFAAAQGGADPELRQRRAVEALIARWQAAPPEHPVIVAGSTGSRGTTALLMRAVARLPQGAVVLPGVDFDLPHAVWGSLDDALEAEDHPQFRFARLLQGLDLTPADIARWTDADPRQARNRLVSLALRPAPVTDQWLRDGPALGDLRDASGGMTLIEAADPRREALAIALRLRAALRADQSAALITPDRELTRRVTAALDRWRIEPDDSAGRPLALSAPGRFLRHVASLAGRRISAEALLTLLKHPLTSSTAGARGQHLLRTRDLELWLRKKGPAFPDAAALHRWADTHDKAGLADWIAWIAAEILPLADVAPAPLPDLVAAHLAAAERIAAGPGAEGSGALWDKTAGERAVEARDELIANADAGGETTPADYVALFDNVLAGREVRDPVRPDPDVMIWGTLEARVQGADVVILAGLNEGVWPAMPPPDPWLNRRMRHAAGLLLPERRVGLQAHDFQQAIAAREVVLTRATRDAEAETVMSRWLNRLTNLLEGLPDQSGPEALAAMRSRGQVWTDMATALETRFDSVPAATRPAPVPPVAARPRQLSVTRIQTLIRDPYAIYARHILGLKPLPPISPTPDAPLRGTVLHAIFEEIVAKGPDPDAPEARDSLLQITARVLGEEVPWPAARQLWSARIERVADWFLAGERERRATATPLPGEREGRLSLPAAGFDLIGTADRIDQRADGTLAIYDYKTGTPPRPKQIRHFDKQLLLEAAMAEAGAFRNVPAAQVAEVAHIGLGSTPEVSTMRLRDPSEDEPVDPAQVIAELLRLIAAFDAPEKGYPSRRAPYSVDSPGDYDHLARYGEWDETDPAKPEKVGQ